MGGQTDGHGDCPLIVKKKAIITALLALVVMAGQAQEERE